MTVSSAKLCCGYSAEAGKQITDMVLEVRPAATAACFTGDVVALGILERLRECHVEVPRALSLFTFDDVGPLHLFATPLSAIRQPVGEMGMQAGPF